jgi:dipeptidyl aminopeptidase/acylaminoacyl peptidase
MSNLLIRAPVCHNSFEQKLCILLMAAVICLGVAGCSSAVTTNNSDYVLAFHSGTENDHGIYLANGQGGTPTRVTDGSLIAYSPVWSPDGTQIAFVGQSSQETNAAFSVYLLDLATLTIERLTDPRQVIVRNGLTWSPDGKSIAFARTPLAAEDWQLYSVNTDDKRLTHIADGIVLPRWSPDGRWIAGASNDSICLVLVSDKSKRCFDPTAINNARVSADQTTEAMPRAVALNNPFWFFGSTRIGFTAVAKKGHGIYSMRLDGTDIQEHLAPVPLALCDLSWVQDTKQIIMARCAEQAHGLYSLQSSASDLAPLNYGQWADSPSWRGAHK